MEGKKFDERIFHLIRNHKINYSLKKLSEMVGIDESIRETYYKEGKRFDEVLPKYTLLSSHAILKTFIYNALSLWYTSVNYNEMDRT